MQADIITIGDEILIGRTIDTNSAFIADKLNATGIHVHQIKTISDREEDIIKALDDSIQTAGLIIVTGGLGPTNDDVTKQTLANYFQSSLVENQEILNHIRSLLLHRGVPISELNRKQAEIPDNCKLLNNINGTAPGMVFQKKDAMIVSLPGVPYEMKEIVTSELIPLLKERLKLPFRTQITLMTSGVAESVMAERLKEFEEKLPGELSLAYLPEPGILKLRLSISGDNEQYLKGKINKYKSKLLTLLGSDFYGYNDDKLEEVLGRLLKENTFSLSTAESCTAGNLARRIASVPGASAYFMGSIVAYDNDIKSGLLGVEKELIEEYGAVSEQVVTQMADRARVLFKTTYSIATSGIAGPGGGTSEKPVGTTWIAISTPQKTLSYKFNFGEHRGRNITKTTNSGLKLLLDEIHKVLKNNTKKV